VRGLRAQTCDHGPIYDHRFEINRRTICENGKSTKTFLIHKLLTKTLTDQMVDGCAACGIASEV
jgi:hypothetical protein